MSRLIPPKLFTAQPAYPALIDSMHPLGSKVTAAIAAHINGCRTELITGRAGTIAGTAPSRITKQRGLAANATGTSGIYFPATKMWGDGTQPFSIDLMIEGNGGNTQFDRIFDFGGNASSGGWDIEVQSTTTQLNFTPWAGPTPANFSFGAINLMGAGQVSYLTIVLDNNATVHLYVNGVQTASFGSVSISASAKANAFFACADTSGNNSAEFGLHFLRVFNGTIITPGQAAELAANPWQLFSAPRSLVIGSTSVSPNVSLTGVAATGAVANFGENVQPSLTGVAATAAAATVMVSTTNLHGVAATATAAPFVLGVSPSLTGVQAIAFAAGITNQQLNLVAVAATGAAAGFTPSPSLTLTGVAATGVAAPFTSSQTILNFAAAIGVAAPFALAPSVTLIGVAATAGVAGFTIPVATNYVMNAATGYYALNGLAAVFTLNIAPEPAFDPTWTWDMTPDSGLEFISYNVPDSQLFVQYLTGFAKVYSNVSQSAAAQIVDRVRDGMLIEQVLSGLH